MEQPPIGVRPEIRRMASPYREMLSPLERTNEQLEQLTEEYNRFNIALDELFSEKVGEELFKQINANHFTSEMIDQIGVKGEKAHVFYGDWRNQGNAEGSLYSILNDGDILRVRWAGARSIYLNGGENHVEAERDEKNEGEYKLMPRTINGRKIIGIRDEGVETEHPDYWEYLSRQSEYEYKLEELKRRRENVFLRLQDKLTKSGKTEEPLVEPVKPKNEIIPHSVFMQMLEKMENGLKVTMETLKKAKGETDGTLST